MPNNIDTQSKIDLSNGIDISRRQIAEGKGIPGQVIFNEMHGIIDCLSQSIGLRPGDGSLIRVLLRKLHQLLSR